MRDIPLRVDKTIAYFPYFVNSSQHHFLRGNEKAGARNAFRQGYDDQW